jgi:hypothetical protein
MIRYQWLQAVTPHSASTVCFGRNCSNIQPLSKINPFVCYLTFWNWHRITIWLTTSWLWPSRLLCWKNMYVILALFTLVWVGKFFLDCRCFHPRPLKSLGIIDIVCRSLWPCRLRRGSVATRLLGLRISVPPGTWMSVSWSAVCCQVEVSPSGWSLVQRSSTDCN